MKPRCSNQRNQALTITEVLVVVAVLLVLAVYYLQRQTSLIKKAPRIDCLNNLKEVGLSYRLWADDNGGKFPMEISITNGGTKELVADGKNAWLNYLVMSNELNTPKLLVCIADAKRFPPAMNFSTELDGKISYFVGLNASTNFPQSLLSGDDNLEVSGGSVKSGLLELPTNTSIAWAATRHIKTGNMHLALQKTGLATNRLAIP